MLRSVDPHTYVENRISPDNCTWHLVSIKKHGSRDGDTKTVAQTASVVTNFCLLPACQLTVLTACLPDKQETFSRLHLSFPASLFLIVAEHVSSNLQTVRIRDELRS